jgi:hypothetical protein
MKINIVSLPKPERKVVAILTGIGALCFPKNDAKTGYCFLGDNNSGDSSMAWEERVAKSGGYDGEVLIYKGDKIEIEF